MIYFVYLFLLLLLLKAERVDIRLSRVCRVTIPVIYTLFIGLRGKNVGVDTHTYYDHYYIFGRWGCDFVEIGFDWLNRFFYSLGWGANSLFLAITGISCLFFYLALEKLKGKYYTVAAFFIYLFTFAFLINGIRQGVSVAVFIYAYKFIEERKWYYYIPCILFASLFHASALLLLPIYLINLYHLPGKIYTYIYILSFIGLFVDLSPYLPQIELGNRDYSRYAMDVKVASASSLGFIVTTLLNIIVFVLILKNQLYKKIPLLVNFIILSFCLKNIAFNIPIINRVSIYFTWYIFIILPYIFYSCRSYLLNSRKFSITCIMLIYFATWFNSLFSDANRLLPYLFYWEI